jgi:hypothetical protein
MRNQTFNKAVLYCSLMLVAVLSTQIIAQPSSSGGFRGRGIYGDWQIKMKFGEREFESILSLSRNQEGQYTGQLISLWGANDLKDVKFEENKLSFTQVFRSSDNEITQNFTGTVEDGKITGVMSGDRGESKIEGQRSPRMSRAVGNWEMKFKIGDREITTTLAVKASKEGELMAEWQSEWGEHKITDLQYERGKLTFKRESKFQDRQMESTFEGTIARDNTLTGAIKSEMGEVQVEGKLIGAALIGTWDLDMEFEWGGTGKQRLRVNPDLSALYGSYLIKKINLDGDKVSFKLVRSSGDGNREFEFNFEGKIADTKLTGELTRSPGSTAKVTGTKQVFRRRNTGQ